MPSESPQIIIERNDIQKRFASHVQQNVLRAKVVVVGTAATGKTTMLRLFNGENFDAKYYKMTQRTDVFPSKRVKVNDSTQVEFMFFDSGGAQIFNFVQEQSQYVRCHLPTLFFIVCFSLPAVSSCFLILRSLIPNPVLLISATALCTSDLCSLALSRSPFLNNSLSPSQVSPVVSHS